MFKRKLKNNPKTYIGLYKEACEEADKGFNKEDYPDEWEDYMIESLNILCFKELAEHMKEEHLNKYYDKD